MLAAPRTARWNAARLRAMHGTLIFVRFAKGSMDVLESRQQELLRSFAQFGTSLLPLLAACNYGAALDGRCGTVENKNWPHAVK